MSKEEDIKRIEISLEGIIQTFKTSIKLGLVKDESVDAFVDDIVKLNNYIRVSKEMTALVNDIKNEKDAK